MFVGTMGRPPVPGGGTIKSTDAPSISVILRQLSLRLSGDMEDGRLTFETHICCRAFDAHPEMRWPTYMVWIVCNTACATYFFENWF